MENIKKLTPKQIAVAAIIAVLAIAAIVPHFIYPSNKGAAYVQVDTATYNTLVRDNDSLRFTLDSIMLLHSKVSSDITKEVAAQLRRRALIDSVYKVIDNRLDTLYADRVSSANLVPYEEFASAIVTIPYEDVQSRCNFLDITDDPELLQAFQTFFDAKNMEYFNKANEQLRSKPSFFNAGLSDEEIQFFDSLYLAGLPYQPYTPKNN
jgi:hypothetical protein